MLKYDYEMTHNVLIRKLNLESILSNFDFFVFSIFAFKLVHFKGQTIFSCDAMKTMKNG
jgi:hypothetical protein